MIVKSIHIITTKTVNREMIAQQFVMNFLTG